MPVAAEVSVLATAAYGVLEIRDIEADETDDDAMRAANETVAASSGVHLYLRCLQQESAVRVTVRVWEQSLAGSAVDAPATPPAGWDGERRGLALELESGRLVIMQLTSGPALEWNVPGGPGAFSVDVRYRNRELAAQRSSAVFARAAEEGWAPERIRSEAQSLDGLEEYEIDLHPQPGGPP